MHPETHRYDRAMAEAIVAEALRARGYLTGISSENYEHPASMAAFQAGVVTNGKYAEDRPGARCYGGCEQVDVIERLTRQRWIELVSQHVPNCPEVVGNVQPYSGSPANAAIVAGLYNRKKHGFGPGLKRFTILGQGMNHGGHITHNNLSFHGMVLDSYSYSLRLDGSPDMAEVERLALEHRPDVIFAGGSAITRFIDWAEFRRIADLVGAIVVADISHISLLVFTGLHPHPFPFAHYIMTTTHKLLRGPRGGVIACFKGKYQGEGIFAGVGMGAAMNRGVFPLTHGGPHMGQIAAKGTCFLTAMQPGATVYSHGVVASAKAQQVVFAARGIPLQGGGTDVHHNVLDFCTPSAFDDIGGQAAVDWVYGGRITTSKSSVPSQQQGFKHARGLRVGTPALCARLPGLWDDMVLGTPEASAWIDLAVERATWMATHIADILESRGDAAVVAAVAAEVEEWCMEEANWPYPSRYFPARPQNGCDGDYC